MSTFIAIVPLDRNGDPELLPDIEARKRDKKADVSMSGSQYRYKELPPEGQAKNRRRASTIASVYGTRGGKGVLVFTGSKQAMAHLLAGRKGDTAYDFQTLEDAWQDAGIRDHLKANGCPWVKGEFGPVPGSTYGRPLLERVFCGQSHDPFAPEVP